MPVPRCRCRPCHRSPAMPGLPVTPDRFERLDLESWLPRQGSKTEAAPRRPAKLVDPTATEPAICAALWAATPPDVLSETEVPAVDAPDLWLAPAATANAEGVRAADARRLPTPWLTASVVPVRTAWPPLVAVWLVARVAVGPNAAAPFAALLPAETVAVDATINAEPRPRLDPCACTAVEAATEAGPLGVLPPAATRSGMAGTWAAASPRLVPVAVAPVAAVATP